MAENPKKYFKNLVGLDSFCPTPPRKIAPNMKNITLENQMELTLVKTIAGSKNNRQNRTRRAGWWFGQMRQVVDRAIDRKPRPTPPTHQVYLALQQQHGPNW
jgi:hypothetical protein